MGFSKSCFEQYQREIRILRRVLAVGALAAAGFHLFYVPAIIRYASGLTAAVDPVVELETTPVEIVVVDELIAPPPEPVTPPPTPEAAATDQPAAGAEEPSPLPLASDPVVPEPASAASIDTVATGPAIASETGAEDGEGAAGEADAVGVLPGSGSPEGDPTAPVAPPPVRTEPPRERQPVQEVARARPPSARTVTCDPCTQPDYPLTERRDRIEGQPVINVIFDPNGNVVTAEIEQSSGNAAFDQAALEEARRNWRFRDPYGVGGQVSVEVTFVITGSEQHDAAQSAGRRETIELPVQQSITPVAPASAGVAPEAAEEPAASSAPESAENVDADSPDPSESETVAPTAIPEAGSDDSASPEAPSATPNPDAVNSGTGETPPPVPSPSNSVENPQPVDDNSSGEAQPVIAPSPHPTGPPPTVEAEPAVSPAPMPAAGPTPALEIRPVPELEGEPDG